MYIWPAATVNLPGVKQYIFSVDEGEFVAVVEGTDRVNPPLQDT